MSTKHTPRPWVIKFRNDHSAYISMGDPSKEHKQFDMAFDARYPSDVADARLMASAPEYHDAAEEILQAVTANAAPINPLAALEEMSISGDHITLDAGLVLALLKAHAKATGEAA